jgi:hypothetical protein
MTVNSKSTTMAKSRWSIRRKMRSAGKKMRYHDRLLRSSGIGASVNRNYPLMRPSNYRHRPDGGGRNSNNFEPYASGVRHATSYGYSMRHDKCQVRTRQGLRIRPNNAYQVLH